MNRFVCVICVFAAIAAFVATGCPKPPAEDSATSTTSTTTTTTSTTTTQTPPETKVPDASAAEMKIGTTDENLQTALNGESSAKARYEAFAVKADEEGYKGIAVLFRAAAKAEGIHAQSYIAIFKAEGKTPEVTIDTPVVKTTAENLSAAITGESFERDTMYPKFVEKAKSEGNTEAAKRFNFANQVEAIHSELFQKAVSELETWRDARTFYVCPECGNTVENIPTFEKCPICLTPKEKFIKVE
jgi:rubrerythrin